LRAIRALLRDPDDPARVFEAVDALSGRSPARLLHRFQRTDTGHRLLRERPDLRAVLSDLASLRSLPHGSLGRVYADFATRERITPDALLEASRAGGRAGPPPSEEARWFDERIRVMHDVWHVTTGYGRDLVGEAALLAFTFAQTRNPAFGFLLVGLYAKAGEMPGARRTIREGWRRGRSAAWLPGQDWEALLLQPLDEVRTQLEIGEPPVYRAVRPPVAVRAS
jgi:ubiquinone biosynthesis protein COQ4